MKIETFSAEETYALGKKLGSEAKPGDVLTLIGDLGVGKTDIYSGICRWTRDYRTHQQPDFYHCAGV